MAFLKTPQNKQTKVNPQNHGGEAADCVGFCETSQTPWLLFFLMLQFLLRKSSLLCAQLPTSNIFHSLSLGEPMLREQVPSYPACVISNGFAYQVLTTEPNPGTANIPQNLILGKLQVPLTAV